MLEGMRIGSILRTLICILISGCASSRVSELAVVQVPVADLRRTPYTYARAAVHDEAQESQLLFGEHVQILERRGDWARVAAIEQPEYSHNQRWEGYPGWVPIKAIKPVKEFPKPGLVVVSAWARAWQDADLSKPHPLRLPMGAQLNTTSSTWRAWGIRLPDGSLAWVDRSDVRTLSSPNGWTEQEQRAAIVEAAETFIGMQYFWGGRSPHLALAPATGVDCSSLVGLAYRTAGLTVPRDAHEQALQARPTHAPKAGDLVFLSAKDDPKRVVHVMLIADDDELIEAPGTGLAVRRISSRKRLGASLAQIKPGTRVNGQTVSFGSFLPSGSAGS